jgi:hypothetical protein
MDESPNRKVVNDRIADLPTRPVDNRQQAMTAFYNLAFQPDRVDCAIATAYLGWSQAELERSSSRQERRGRESSRPIASAWRLKLAS